MKAFIHRILRLILPILLLMVVVNYTCDPAKLFDDNYEKSIAKIVHSGQHATNILNYDERILQKEIIQIDSSNANIRFIGSSRGMLINEGLFESTRFFNHGVSGASIEDLIALYQLLKSSNKLPKKFIIGVDPWTFNENSEQVRWASISKAYNDFHQQMDNPFIKEMNKYQNLISPSYFQSSILYLPELFKENQPIPTDTKHNINSTKLKDGSVSYKKKYRETSKKIRANNITQYLSKEMFAIENFEHVSDEIWNEFETLLNTLKKDNIEVLFYLEPYPPRIYKMVEKDYPMVIKTEALIIDYAKRNHIKIIGSFNPAFLQLEEDDFLDEKHVNEKTIQKIFSSIPFKF